MPHEVIMPALGVSQDSGVIVAWHKSAGETVRHGDLLMEVETDKAVVELEADVEGILSRILANEGDDVPVGQVVAVIGSGQDDPAVAPEPEPARKSPVAKDVPAEEKPFSAPASVRPDPMPRGSRILASPKARRLAAERGIDLKGAVHTGHPQPFHVADIERLSLQRDTGRAPRRIAARSSVTGSDLGEFLTWVEAETGKDRICALAAFAAGAFRAVTGAETLAVLASAPGKAGHRLIDPDRSALGALAPEGAAVACDLVVHDLTLSQFVESVECGDAPPTFCVAADGGRTVATFSADSAVLDSDRLVACLEGFAARLDEPLRHLL